MILWRRFASVLGTLATITVIFAQEPKLTIPGDAERRPPLGENLFLECTVSPVNIQSISKVRWLDPQGNEILESGNPRIYTEVIEGKGRSLFIQTSQEQDAGEYICEAEYPGNPTLRSSIKVSFYREITFVDAPPIQNPIVGTDAVIKCIVRGNPPPYVDWKKDGIIISTMEVNGQNSRYSLEDGGLRIKKFAQDDDGIYQCRARVRETGSLKLQDIHVEVHIPPIFVEKPTEQRKIEGETIALTCRATGKPSPQYTWTRRLEGANFEELPTDRFSVDQKTGALMIRELQHSDRGYYQCRAWNAAGEVTDGAELFVILKPIINELKNITGVDNQAASITCQASGEPAPTLQWKKVGSSAPFLGGTQPDDSRIVVTTEPNGIARLSINPLHRPDDGLYICTATNEGGETHQNGHITVQYQPNIVDKTPTTSYFTWQQNPINLTCIAEAIPNATITWQRDNDLKIKDNPNFVTFGGLSISLLQVNPVDHSYFGVYTCSAENSIGSSDLRIDLKEAVRPGIIDNVQFKLVTATTITFEFNGPREDGGRPILGYEVLYYKDGISHNAAQSRYLSIGNPYIVDNLEPEQMYFFRFAAKNDVGLGMYRDGYSQRMAAVGPPLVPLILSSNTSIHANRYSLQWMEPISNGDPVSIYDVRWWRIQLQHGQIVNVDKNIQSAKVHAPGINYWIENLDPLTSYKVELRAVNKLGDSLPAVVTFTTAKGAGDTIKKSITGSGQNGLSSGAIVGIVIAVILVLLLIVDISCYTMYQCGVLMFLCIKVCGKQPPAAKAKEVAMEEGKTGKEKEPIKDDELNEKNIDEKQEEQEEEKEASEDTPMIEGNEKEKESYEKEVTVDNIDLEIKDKPTEA